MNVGRFASVLAVVCAISQCAYAGGGAKIVNGQPGGCGIGGAGGFGYGPIANWIMDQGDLIIRDRFGLPNVPDTTSFATAKRRPEPDPRLTSLNNRLDNLNNMALPPNVGRPVFANPPIVDDVPGVMSIPSAGQITPSSIPE